MHVMIATDGSLDPAKAAELAARLAGEEGRVTVMSAVEMPRQLLKEMRDAALSTADERARELSVEYRSTQADNAPVTSWVGDDAVVDMYVNRKVHDRTDDLAGALAGRGVDHEVIGIEAENPARAVLDAIVERGVDILCIGTHGLGRFEGLLGSVSTKLARRAPCSVVLVR